MPDTPPARSAAPLLQDRRSVERNSSRLFQRYRAENELRGAQAPTTTMPNANRGCIATRQKPLPPTHRRTTQKSARWLWVGSHVRSQHSGGAPEPATTAGLANWQVSVAPTPGERLETPVSPKRDLCNCRSRLREHEVRYRSPGANGHPSTPA